MHNRFFLQYKERADAVGDTVRRKEAERSRDIIDVTAEFVANERRKRKLAEQQERLNNCYNESELFNRIDEALGNIWYVPVLAENDVTKFETVRKSRFVDAIIALLNLIELRL